jgi:hypothetical protein
MENDIFSITLIAIFSVGILYGAYTITKNRSEAILNRWAFENGYRIVDYQGKVFNRGPFTWASKSQIIFRVMVEDPEGTQRTGWVKCGSYWGGIFSDQAEVKWD